MFTINKEKKYLKIGHEYFQNEEYDLALEAYNKVIEINPNNHFAYHSRGFILAKLKKYEAAIKDLEFSVPHYPNNYDGYIYLGYAYFTVGNFDAALDNFHSAINLNPKSHFGYANAGDVFLKLKDYKNALDNFEKEHKIKASTQNYINQVNALINLQRYKDSLSIIEKCFLLYSDNIDLYYWRGVAYYYSNQFDAALTDLNHYLKTASTPYKGYIFRGYSYFKLDNYEEALNDFTKAMQIDLEEDEAYIGRADVFFEEGKFDLAFNNYTRAVKLNPESPRGHHGRGRVYSVKGDLESAIKEIDKAEKVSNNASYASVRGWIYLYHHRLKEAEIELKVGWKLYKEKDKYIAENLGHLALLKGDLLQAFQWYSKSKSLYENDDLFFKNLRKDYKDLRMSEKGISEHTHLEMKKDLEK